MHCLSIDTQNFIEAEENILNKFILKIKCYIAAIRNKSDTKYNMKLIIISKNIKLDFVEYIQKQLYRMSNIQTINTKLFDLSLYMDEHIKLNSCEYYLDSYLVFNILYQVNDDYKNKWFFRK